MRLKISCLCGVGEWKEGIIRIFRHLKNIDDNQPSNLIPIVSEEIVAHLEMLSTSFDT